MGKFLSRFAIGTVLGLLGMWVWSRLNQNDDSLEDDDEIVEIQIGGNKPATDSVIATGVAKPEREVGEKARTATQQAASSATQRAGTTAPLQASTAELAKTSAGTDAAPAQTTAADTPAAASTADEVHSNLEWVNGIGPVFNRVLSDAGIRSDEDLANASIESLRATGINRDDEEFASWIEQAKQQVGGK